MNNKYRRITAIAAMVVVIGACSVGYGCGKPEPAPVKTVDIDENKQAIIDALVEEAKSRVETKGNEAAVYKFLPSVSESVYYPEKFDLRAVDTDGDGKVENYVTSVKDQSPFGTCWAFGTISAAETSILYDLKQDAVIIDENGNPHDSINLSEHHLGWFAYTPLPEDDEQAGEGLYSQVAGVEENPSLRMTSGSTQFAASNVFASGMGPVAEPDFNTTDPEKAQLSYHGANRILSITGRGFTNEDDWSIDESQRFRQDYMLEDIYFLPASTTAIEEKGGYNMETAGHIIENYKEQIMKGRAVAISFFADNYSPSKENRVQQYINFDGGTYAHYCYDNRVSNHVVTIVGWDDNYSVSNFLTEVQEIDDKGMPLFNEDGSKKMKSVSQPPADGAWIVKNSWGAKDSIADGPNQNPWGYDGTGYFYLSYYDLSTDSACCFDFDVENKLRDELGEYILEEHDFLPSEVAHSVTTNFPVATANVFKTSDKETVRAISCQTTRAHENVKIEIYKFGITKSELVSSMEKRFPNAGLHVVELDEPCAFEKGESFAVVVTQQTNDGFIFSVGSEFNKKAFDAGLCNDDYEARAVVNSGESYIYLAGPDEWWDFAEVKEMLEAMDGATSYLTYDNFPIKAYASIG